jgi:hypothetical protein
MSTENVSKEQKGNDDNRVLAFCCYSTEEGRKFNLLKKNKRPFNERILIHTFDDEVLSVKANDSGLGIEFRDEEDSIFCEEYEVKGWSFWQ